MRKAVAAGSLVAAALAVGGTTASADPASDHVLSSSEDVLVSPNGDDTLIAPNGDDTLVAPAGDDTLIAPDGNDILRGIE